VKACSSCYRLYPDDAGFCPVDGAKLGPTDEVKPSPDPEDPRVGKALCGGRYVIYRRVADGAMGRVYQALDTKVGRTVALKILHAEVAADPVSLERFKREFKVSAALPHEHIVEVLSFEDTEDKSYALVMEYLEGEELRMVFKREKTLAPARVVRIVSQLAIGLSAAHERSIVHRDLKPDNVFLCGTRDGDVVKVLDFGSVRDNTVGAKKLTVMGTTIGTPFYMSPEQAQGLESLDHRADVWSVATIVYEGLTGKVPFEGTTGPAILLNILASEPKAPSEVSATLPKTLDPVMEDALTKNPDIRIKSVVALAERVGKALGLEGDHTTWAKTPEADLAKLIEAGIPAALAAYEAQQAAAAAPLAMDAAFKEPPAGFQDDLVMGVPSGPPKWLIPVIAAALVIGVLVVVLAFR